MKNIKPIGLFLIIVLLIFLSNHPFSTLFAATEITVTNAGEFIKAIGPDRVIILNPGTYNLSTIKREPSQHIGWEEVNDGYQLSIHNLNNLTLKSLNDMEAKLVVEPRYAYVISFKNVSNVTISGIVAGHTEEGVCRGGVFNFQSSDNIQITGSDLYGCGTEGLTLSEVTGLKFSDSKIHDCTYSIMTVTRSQNIIFSNSTFYKNQEFDLINIFEKSTAKFHSCIIKDNSARNNALFVVKNSDVTLESTEIRNNQVGALNYGDREINIDDQTIITDNSFTRDSSYISNDELQPGMDQEAATKGGKSAADPDQMLKDLYRSLYIRNILIYTWFILVLIPIILGIVIGLRKLLKMIRHKKNEAHPDLIKPKSKKSRRIKPFLIIDLLFVVTIWAYFAYSDSFPQLSNHQFYDKIILGLVFIVFIGMGIVFAIQSFIRKRTPSL